jgi:SAM-dependent methyltransferase
VPRPSRRSKLTARRADKYELYQRAVQAPDHDVDFIERLGRKHSGRSPSRLREDFCGTALLSATWVASREDREAWALDIDPEPLAWGLEHNVAPLGEDARRVHLLRKDVLEHRTPACDVVVAPNFSFCCFHDRATLLAYFKAARAALRPGGFLLADVFGGPEAMEELVETRRVGGFTYVWEQSRFDPITSSLTAHIGFRFPDGTRLRRAFSYEWRLWSLPELRDIVADAGFQESHVYWELTGPNGRGNGVFRRMEHAAACDSFVCSIVAVR